MLKHEQKRDLTNSNSQLNDPDTTQGSLCTYQNGILLLFIHDNTFVIGTTIYYFQEECILCLLYIL